MFKTKANIKYILGIETSCDDTSIAIYHPKHYDLLTISSVQEQINYGGVVPEVAARSHEQNLLPILKQLFKKNKINFDDISHIAYTNEPGLKVCLNTGKIFAKTLSFLHNKPLIPINHLHAHLFSFALDNQVIFPFIGLVISGGHTIIYLVKSFFDIKILNSTLDDAVGEVYDKIGRKLNINYPCGPYMDKIYDEKKANIIFVHKKINPADSFSFSGLKSQVLNYIDKNKHIDQISIASSFQKTIINIVVEKIIYYSNLYQIKNVVIGGGVAANSLLQKMLSLLNFNLMIPNKKICGDNALMIALLAYLIK